MQRLAGNKISLKSCHQKFVSVQTSETSGEMQVNRDKSQAWEHFSVLPPHVEGSVKGNIVILFRRESYIK